MRAASYVLAIGPTHDIKGCVFIKRGCRLFLFMRVGTEAQLGSEVREQGESGRESKRWRVDKGVVKEAAREKKE